MNNITFKTILKNITKINNLTFVYRNFICNFIYYYN